MGLEQLKSILGRAIVPSSSLDSRQKNDIENSIDNTIMSNDPKAEQYNPPKAITCEYCGVPRYTKGIFLGNMIMWMPYGLERCGCSIQPIGP